MLLESIMSQTEIEKIATKLTQILEQKLNQSMQDPNFRWYNARISINIDDDFKYRGPLSKFWNERLSKMAVMLRGNENAPKGKSGSYLFPWINIDLTPDLTTEWIHTILVHEITHAYDDFLSKGKYHIAQANPEYRLKQHLAKSVLDLTDPQMPSYVEELADKFRMPKKQAMAIYKKMLSKGQLEMVDSFFKDYLRLPHEINARYQQAVSQIRDKKLWRAKTPGDGFDDYGYEFRRNFDGWYDMKDDVKKALMRRLYKEYNTLRGAELRQLIADELNAPFWDYALGEEQDFNSKDYRIKNFDIKKEMSKLLHGMESGRITGKILRKRWPGAFNAIMEMYLKNKKGLQKMCKDFGVDIGKVLKSVFPVWDHEEFTQSA